MRQQKKCKTVLALLSVFFIVSAVGASPVEARTRKTVKPPARSRRGGGPTVSGSGERRVHEEGQTVVYKKKTEVDFDDSLIEGEVKNPSEFYFVHRPEQKYPGLVKKRPNFHKEMLRDTVMIR